MLKNQFKTLRHFVLAFASFMALSSFSLASSSTAEEFLAIGDTAVEKKCAAQVRLALNLNPTDKIPLSRINDVKALSFNVLDGPLPVWLSRFTGLLSLSVENSKLQTLPAWIGDLKKLIILRCSNCQLQDLPLTLSNLPKLEELWLKGNKFAKVPVVIANLKGLEQLGLSNLDISEEGLNATLAALPKLKGVSLARGTLQTSEKISHLDVSKNLALSDLKLRNQGISKVIGLENLPVFKDPQAFPRPVIDMGGCPIDQTWFKGLPPVVQKRFGGF